MPEGGSSQRVETCLPGYSQSYARRLNLNTARYITPLLSILVGMAVMFSPERGTEASNVLVDVPLSLDIERVRAQPASDRQPLAQTATEEAAPAPTSEPVPTIVPTPTPVPTPTLDPVTRITTEHILNHVMPWGVVVENHIQDSDPEIALILSVMAAESMGDPYVVSYAGACGVMQVIWKPWFGVSKSALCNDSQVNIMVGIRILRGALGLATDKGLEERYGIAYYNCSIEGVHTDMCGSKGGLHYADRVLEFWLPRVQERIDSCVQEYGDDFWGSREGYDLPGCSW